MFDPVAEIKVYADEALTRELLPSDVIDATNSNNVVDLYIAFDDDVSDRQRIRIVELFGSDMGLYFDIVREYQGQYFRDFSMVESIEVRTIFKTERLIKAFEKRVGDYAYVNLSMMAMFDFAMADFAKPYIDSSGKLALTTLFACPIHKAYTIMFPLGELYLDESDPKRYLLGRYANRNMVVWTTESSRYMKLMSSCEPYTPNSMEEKPPGSLLTWLFSGNYIEKTVRKSRRIMLNTFLYGNGAFGLPLNMVGDMRPTMYETMTAFASDPPNASYTLAQLKREIGPRWAMWNQVLYEEGRMLENVTTYQCDYGVVTRMVGLGIVDTQERKAFLQADIERAGTSCDNGGGATYYITGEPAHPRSLSSYIHAVTHSDGRVGAYDFYGGGAGKEHLFFGTVAYMREQLGLSEDDYYAMLRPSVVKKGLDIVHSCIDDFKVRNRIFCEFFDLEHACPFDDVEAYVPIPLQLSTMQPEEIYMNTGVPAPSNAYSYVVYKRRYEEDEYGNVTLIDLPEEHYPIGTFAIPFNKNEYVHRVFVKKAFHTFVSRDHIVHIKVRFKKMPNRMQNIRFRVFSANHLFGKEVLIDA